MIAAAQDMCGRSPNWLSNVQTGSAVVGRRPRLRGTLYGAFIYRGATTALMYPSPQGDEGQPVNVRASTEGTLTAYRRGRTNRMSNSLLSEHFLVLGRQMYMDKCTLHRSSSRQPCPLCSTVVNTYTSCNGRHLKCSTLYCTVYCSALSGLCRSTVVLSYSTALLPLKQKSEQPCTMHWIFKIHRISSRRRKLDVHGSNL